jgi:hypothetical protein
VQTFDIIFGDVLHGEEICARKKTAEKLRNPKMIRSLFSTTSNMRKLGKPNLSNMWKYQNILRLCLNAAPFIQGIIAFITFPYYLSIAEEYQPQATPLIEGYQMQATPLLLRTIKCKQLLS